MKVEFLKVSDNAAMGQGAEVYLSEQSVHQLYADHNGCEDFACQSDRERFLADARYNAELIRDGIGVSHEGGFLTLRHGDNKHQFRGSSVERWSVLTDDDRSYCISLMAIDAGEVG